MNSSGKNQTSRLPIRQLFQTTPIEFEDLTQFRPASTLLKDDGKSDILKDSQGEEQFSLTLSQSPESYIRANDGNFSKSVVKYNINVEQLDPGSKSKRVSQGSVGSIQNNRYNQTFEGDRSGISCSFGERLLDNSRLLTEEFNSPSQSKTFKDLSKYLRSENHTPNQNQDLVFENQPLIRNITKSYESNNKSSEVEKSQGSSKQAQMRYEP